MLILLLLAGSLATAQDVTGDWQGSLKAAGAELRLVLHITKAADGTLKATLDSVDQNANGIPVSSVALKGSQLSLDIVPCVAATRARWHRTAKASQARGSKTPLCR